MERDMRWTFVTVSLFFPTLKTQAIFLTKKHQCFHFIIILGPVQLLFHHTDFVRLIDCDQFLLLKERKVES